MPFVSAQCFCFSRPKTFSTGASLWGRVFLDSDFHATKNRQSYLPVNLLVDIELYCSLWFVGGVDIVLKSRPYYCWQFFGAGVWGFPGAFEEAL